MEGQPEEPDYVFGTIHDLMTRSSKLLIETHALNPLDVLSFLGRSLFFRFLWDRKIVRSSELHSICPHAKSFGDCFRNVTNSVATCRWLDETFNGDMLPLSGELYIGFQPGGITDGWADYFSTCKPFWRDGNMQGTEGFQLQIDWGDLDFAHIPIGVLSQVYENFSKIWDSQQRVQTSAYYTPKNIAAILWTTHLKALAKERCPDSRSSCGAGIFLVLAFRKLVAARWEHDDKHQIPRRSSPFFTISFAVLMSVNPPCVWQRFFALYYCH